MQARGGGGEKKREKKGGCLKSKSYLLSQNGS
jgi:hypothetical protein